MRRGVKGEGGNISDNMSIFLFNTFKHAGVTIQRGVDEIDARFSDRMPA